MPSAIDYSPNQLLRGGNISWSWEGCLGCGFHLRNAGLVQGLPWKGHAGPRRSWIFSQGLSLILFANEVCRELGRHGLLKGWEGIMGLWIRRRGCLPSLRCLALFRLRQGMDSRVCLLQYFSRSHSGGAYLSDSWSVWLFKRSKYWMMTLKFG